MGTSVDFGDQRQNIPFLRARLYLHIPELVGCKCLGFRVWGALIFS